MRFRVDDPIAVALERGADGIFGLGTEPALRLHAFGGLRRRQVPLVVRAALEWSSFDYVRQKTRPVCKFRHGEHLGERLAEIGKCRPRPEIDAFADCSPGQQPTGTCSSNDPCSTWSGRSRGRQ